MSDTQPPPPPPPPPPRPHAPQLRAASVQAPSAHRRRRFLPWLVAAVIVAALAVAAWFVGESIARDLVTKTIRDQVVTRLALPADQQVDVDVRGAVLPQLIGGELHDVSVASDDVALGSLTGDIALTATDVPVRGDAPAGGGTATVTLDTGQLQTLMATVDGFPADSLGLAAPDVTVSTELRVFGIAIPVGVSLTPSAADGDIVLSPASLQLGGAEISAGDLRDRFGSLADVVVRDWNVCIAQYIPAGVALQQVDVVGDTVVARLDIDGAIITEPSLQANGTCA
ncbi:DUF2993 domain-containing protein [Microbacterium sp. P02]|uniref:LmeA family phospholipid-binding protein n=1 Tax=Microbacterium sp. P02 TaxID=3366260 RepID=UPI00367027C8